MYYRLDTLSSEDFEKLVCDICQEILGTGTISFSQGPDGGRDGRFNGTSNKFPSESKKWSGKFIIQAKKKSSPTASCSDSDFKRSLEEEIKKLKKLKKKGEVDNYLVFTSRSQPANSTEKLIKLIKKSIPLDNVEIIGQETITRYLHRYQDIVKRYGLLKFREPLRFNSGDIKIIIEKFYARGKGIKKEFDFKLSKLKFISKEKKNELNKLSKEYFNNIQKESLPYFNRLEKFLKDPRNKNFKEHYLEITNELKFKITAKRNEYEYFDEVFCELYDFIIENHPELKNRGRLIHALLHYMYWHCDIGKDDNTN